MMSSRAFSLDPYTVLGVDPTSSADEIKEAYRTKSKKHHPDMGRGSNRTFPLDRRGHTKC